MASVEAQKFLRLHPAYEEQVEEFEKATNIGEHITKDDAFLRDILDYIDLYTTYEDKYGDERSLMNKDFKEPELYDVYYDIIGNELKLHVLAVYESRQIDVIDAYEPGYTQYYSHGVQYADDGEPYIEYETGNIYANVDMNIEIPDIGDSYDNIWPKYEPEIEYVFEG